MSVSVGGRTYGRSMSTSASSVISEDEIVDELRAAWAEVSRGYARCWAAMAEVARRTTSGWESAEIAAGLTFTTRRADYKLGCAQAVVDRGPGRDQSSACPNRSQRRRDHHPLSCLTNRRFDHIRRGAAWLRTQNLALHRRARPERRRLPIDWWLRAPGPQRGTGLVTGSVAGRARFGRRRRLLALSPEPRVSSSPGQDVS